MPNFRYPIAPPSAVVVNPFSVAFDYVPDPLHYPLTDEENRELYTTRITINAVAAQTGADRIAHVFPRSNVRFLKNDPGGLDSSELAQRYLDETDVDPLPVRGAWLTLGHPSDIEAIRESSGNPIFPTAFVYHDVLIDREVVRGRIVPKLRDAKITVQDTAGSTSEVTDLQHKLVLWLDGEITAKAVFPQATDLSMPLIPQVNGVRTLRVSALMLDGTGIDQETLNTFLPQLKTNLSTGTPLFQEVFFLIPIPVSQVYRDLPTSELHADHLDHPLASAWPTSPSRWSVLLFSFVDASRGDVTNILTEKRFRTEALTCQIDTETEFPTGKAGLYFFRTAEGQDNLSISVFQTVRDGQAVHESKFLSVFTKEDVPVTGNTVSIDVAADPRGIHRLFVGNTPSGPPGTTGHYFGIPVRLDSLQEFIDAISARHMNTLTTAGSFARIMGYLAEAVAEHLSRHLVTFTDFLYPIGGPLRPMQMNAAVPPSASYPYLIAVAVPLLMSDGDQLSFRDYLQDVDGWRRQAEIDLTSIRRTAWMNNHDDGPPGSGWKIFDRSSYDNSGRADHFLFNSALRLMNALPKYEFGVFLGVERDENHTDLRYNEEGKEFTEWGMSFDYGPEKVEDWILRNLVEEATL